MPKKPILINGVHHDRARERSASLVAVKAQCCPICQRPMFRDDDALLVTPLQKRILDLLQRSGEIDPELLYTALYGSDPDGGPNPKTIDVQINLLNKRLKKHRIAIRRRRPKHPGEPWRLVQIEEAE
jgi:hypothetical protein